MSDCPFCAPDSEPESAPQPPHDGHRPTGLLRRAWRGLQWVFPATLLVLIPKCPMCVAAYIALFTGVSVTIPAAKWIRLLMIALCLTSLAYLVAKRITYFFKEQPCPSPKP